MFPLHSQTKLWLEYAYSLVHEEILKSLHRLEPSDSVLSTGKSYPAFEQLGPDGEVRSMSLKPLYRETIL